MIPPLVDWLAYLGGAVIVSAAVHRYLFWLLYARPKRPASRGVRAAFVALFFLLPLGMVELELMTLTPRAIAAPLMWCAFTWAGFLYFAMGTLLLGDLVRAPPRAALLVALGLSALSMWQALRAPAITERTISVPLFPRDGYRIVHLADLHVGAMIDRAFVEMIVARCNALQPDLVAITGDLVDGSVPELAWHVEPLRELRAKDGVFIALGNHEYFSGADAWVAHLRTLGLAVLQNESVARGDFDVVGVDELSAPEFSGGHAPDYERAFSAVTHPAIVLVHQPMASHEIARRSGAVLQLSGHTHAGQIFPLGALARWDQGCLVGVCRSGALTVHVTSGAGYWGPPMRFMSRAEIAVLTLRTEEVAEHH